MNRGPLTHRCQDFHNSVLGTRYSVLVLTVLLLTSSPTFAADFPELQKPNDRPIPAKDAAKAMTVPPGFNVTLFAGEPDVVQPIAMTFDDRGRLWVVECLSYPKWTTDGTGHDRVVILEDTDGDGRFDKKTVFLDNGSNLSGIEIGFGGVWLCSLPNLIFIPVNDGEDRPAGPPQVVLDGWNLKDTKHNVFNSLGWGPDGWLYGCNGIQARSRVGPPGTPDEKRVYIDCGVWRYHPTRKVFEAVAFGTTNPFGLDWDDYGEMFITNCVIDHLWHVVPGGHYKRMYGEDPNPHAYGLMGSCCDHLHWGGGAWTSSRSTGVGGDPKHSEAGGGHAHAGCLVYLGDNFPAEYRNSVFMCNIHGNRLNRDRLERTPSGYVAKHGPDFLFANDAWFRGLCVKSGPDGGLYVSDWTDTGECHNYNVVDATNGRVYKVVYGTPRPWKGDISKLSDAELVKLQLHPNDWFVRHARRVLQERAAAGKLEMGTGEALQAILDENKDVTRRLRAIWALEVIGWWDDRGGPFKLLYDRDEAVRAWGYRIGLSRHERLPNTLMHACDRITKEKSAFVRLSAASAVYYLEGGNRSFVAGPLLERADTADDLNLTLMVWYGVAPWFAEDPQDAIDYLPRIKTPLIRQYTVRLLLTLPKSDTHLASLLTVLTKADSEAIQLDILRGIREAYTGKKEVTAPPTWPAAFAKLRTSKSKEVVRNAEAVAVLFGDPAVIAELTKRVADRSVPLDDRRFALDLLVQKKPAGFAKVLQDLLADPALRGAAVRGLAGFPDDTTPAAILTHYPTFSPAEKADAVQTLASRPAWANALLNAVEKGTIPRADVSVTAARQILALNDKPTADRLEKVWGKITPVSKDRAALIKQWKGKLSPDAMKNADAANGRVLFVKHCAACHKLFGEGGDVGPDLTGSQRANLDYVLENVLDPSAVVPREFQVINFNLKDGRVVSGIILKETPDGLTVRTTNDTVVIAKADVESRKQTSQSIMPEGLLDAMKPEEVRDLVAYLASPQQVPLPKQ
jgi:putative membrane-bound dehydrogenase-like protein